MGSASATTVSSVGNTSAGLVTFNVAPLTPATSLDETIGFRMLGDTGDASCRPQASATAKTADTPITKYSFRCTQWTPGDWKIRPEGNQTDKERVNDTRIASVVLIEADERFGLTGTPLRRSLRRQPATRGPH